MNWIIIGIILFTVTLYVHKHTYKGETETMYEDKMPCPLWLVLLFFVIAIIPYFGVLLFIMGAVNYLLSSTGSYSYIYFKPEGIIKKIKKPLITSIIKPLINILTKEV